MQQTTVHQGRQSQSVLPKPNTIAHNSDRFPSFSPLLLIRDYLLSKLHIQLILAVVTQTVSDFPIAFIERDAAAGVVASQDLRSKTGRWEWLFAGGGVAGTHDV